MIFCDRCGIEVQVKGLCDDCRLVEPEARKRGPMPKEQSRRVHEEILMYAALGIPYREIAEEVGVHVATVGRVVRAQRVVACPSF